MRRSLTRVALAGTGLAALTVAFHPGAGRALDLVPAPSPVGAAADQVNRLRVAPAEHEHPYERQLFGQAWSDSASPQIDGARNGCDTRNDVLRRDLHQVQIKPGTHGCVVLSGTLVDPYTGQTLTWAKGPQSAQVQVDHVVPLGAAWRTGAADLDDTARVALANDPLNLLAVDGPTNQAKRDQDASTWLPQATYQCRYVARQAAVKEKYGLWVTPPEKRAMLTVLSRCPDEPRGDQAGWQVPAPR